MLDDMKSRDRAHTFRIERSKEGHCVALRHFQPAMPALLKHTIIEIHAACAQAEFAHKLKPLPPSTSEIDDRHFRHSDSVGEQDGQVHLQSFLYIFPTPAELILELYIKIIETMR